MHYQIRKKLTVILLLVFLLGCGSKNGDHSSTTKTNVDNLAKTTTTEEPHSGIDPFSLEGYVVLDSARGDLNLDNFDDMVIVLKKEKQTSDVIDHLEKRPLLVLIGLPNHDFELAARSDNAVYCADCGVKESPLRMDISQ